MSVTMFNLLTKSKSAWIIARQGRRIAMRLAGRAPLCGQLNCMSLRQDVDAVRALTSIHEPPKLIEVDGDLQLWRIAGRDWWAPVMRPEFLDKMPKEIQMDIYGLGKLAPGSIVIDGGANIGMFARAALDAGAARVICFEPSPAIRKALTRNLADVSDRVTLRDQALWNEEGKALFAIPLGDAGSDQIVQGEGVRGTETGIEVPLTSIDNVVRELGLTRVDFIKLDIEGAESKALSGASKTLVAFRPRVAIATEHTDDVLKNNRSVLDVMHSTATRYRARCMECDAEQSDSFGGVALTPYVLQLLAL